MDFEEVHKKAELEKPSEKIKEIYIYLGLISAVVGLITLLLRAYIEYGIPEQVGLNIAIGIINVLFYALISLIFVIFGLIFLITGSLFIYVFGDFIYNVIIRFVPYFKRKDFQFDYFERQKIGYDELKKMATEIKKIYPWYFRPFNDIVVNHIFCYVGVSFNIGISFLESEKVLLCNFSQIASNSYKILPAEIEETKPSKKYSIPADEKMHYDFLFQRLVENDWNKIVLESKYNDQTLVKYGLVKDNYIILYEIQSFNNE
ncbi:MAG: hypothetical protein GF308_19280 [Candidatus Heimdallarchaeota archaeon]|nr:hypothetical protein [Candidatus Heimdallarchaeota archaeon]